MPAQIVERNVTVRIWASKIMPDKPSLARPEHDNVVPDSHTRDYPMTLGRVSFERVYRKYMPPATHLPGCSGDARDRCPVECTNK